MIKAAFLALGDVMSADFRAVLYKAVGMTIGLFIAVLIAVEVLISMLTLLPWPWAEAMLAIGTGVALFIVFFFLMAPVMAIFAGFFLDEIAERIERAHYPQDVPGKPLGAAPAIVTALQFAAVVLVVNIAVLPMVFFGVGALALIAANAYLLGREFFEMAATRHMPVAEARLLRRKNTPRIFAAGLIPALLSLVPLVNLVVPLFATTYFVHIFKQVKVSSP